MNRLNGSWSNTGLTPPFHPFLKFYSKIWSFLSPIFKTSALSRWLQSYEWFVLKQFSRILTMFFKVMKRMTKPLWTPDCGGILALFLLCSIFDEGWTHNFKVCISLLSFNQLNCRFCLKHPYAQSYYLIQAKPVNLSLSKDNWTFLTKHGFNSLYFFILYS